MDQHDFLLMQRSYSLGMYPLGLKNVMPDYKPTLFLALNAWEMFFILLVFGANLVPAFAVESTNTKQDKDQIQMQSISVDGQNVPFTEDGEVNLGSFPQNVYLYFGINTNYSPAPVRIRYKLAGFDNTWMDNDVDMIGQMNLSARFFNKKGDMIAEKMFPVSRESPGWTGSLRTSSLTHRRETLLVPPDASKLVIVISSAGPPATVGVYIVANLVVSEFSDKLPPKVLLESPFNLQRYGEKQTADQNPNDWTRDGLRPSLAKIVNLGDESDTAALAILDDSLIGHAEWHNDIPNAPTVTPGDHLVIEWNEMYSIGLGDTRVAVYKTLPAGNFQFCVEAVDLLGNPTGPQLSFKVRVPPPFWRTIWFWSLIGLICMAIVLTSWRYVVLRGVQQQMARLEKQRMLEQERTRIARDIHDDLGARATQISLVSGMARSKPIDPEQAHKDFDQISEMSRDLVSALYETVWSVNPENDNLNELGNYLFQMVNKFCERAGCRCRFYIDLLPREIVVSSQTRHCICMVVKEAVHNAVKHAKASEINVRIACTNLILTISVQDDGIGFTIDDKSPGNGLSNLKQRVKAIHGTCLINSEPGRGTIIQISLELKPPGSV